MDLGGRYPVRAAQCKLHEIGKAISVAEIRSEVEKARAFQPALGFYCIMTTGGKSARTQQFVQRLNEEHHQNDLFTLELLTWDSIEILLDEYPEVRDEFLPVAPDAQTLEPLELFIAHSHADSGQVRSFIVDCLPPWANASVTMQHRDFAGAWQSSTDDLVRVADAALLLVTSDMLVDGEPIDPLVYELQACQTYAVPIIPIAVQAAAAGTATSWLETFALGQPLVYDANPDRFREMLSALGRLPKRMRQYVAVQLDEIRASLDVLGPCLPRTFAASSIPEPDPDIGRYFAGADPEHMETALRWNLTFGSISDAFAHMPRMALLGEPGSGKSYSLCLLARSLFARFRSGGSSRFPILLSLGNWDGAISFKQFLMDGMRARMSGLGDGEFDDLIVGGQLILLLDGLDELGADGSRHQIEELVAFLTSHPRLHVVVTCRLADYSGARFSLKRVLLCELTSADVRSYVHQYPLSAEGRAELEPLLATKGLSQMASIPYLLALLCRIYAVAPRLFRTVRGQGTLFQRYVQMILDGRQRREWSSQDVLDVLAALACAMFWEGKNAVTLDEAHRYLRGWRMRADAALAQARDVYLIRHNVSDGTYSFPHILLRNYLAAVRMHDIVRRWGSVLRLWSILTPGRSVSPHGIHLQLFAFQDAFPEWQQWPFEIIARPYQVADLSQAVAVTGISTETLVDALWTASDERLLTPIHQALVVAASDDVVRSLVSRLRSDTPTEWCIMQMRNQCVWGIWRGYSKAIASLLSMIEAMTSVQDRDPTRQQALYEATQFARCKASALLQRFSLLTEPYFELKHIHSAIAHLTAQMEVDSAAALAQAVGVGHLSERQRRSAYDYDAICTAARHDYAKVGPELMSASVLLSGYAELCENCTVGTLSPKGRSALRAVRTEGNLSIMACVLAYVCWPDVGEDGILESTRDPTLLPRVADAVISLTVASQSRKLGQRG